MQRLAVLSVLTIATVVTGRAFSGDPSQTPTPTARRPGCRVYPSSVTETTTDSTGGRTIMTYSTKFDEAALTSTQNITLSSTQGTRANFQQRMTYASLADFIREGSQSPPFPLYRSMVQTGAINMSTQATYDKADRQLQTITSQPAGQQTITNTAWDKLGRPTAGSISGAGSSSSFTYVYNDVSHTQTHTVVTGPLSVVMTTTFDSDGNAISRSSRGGSQSSTTTIEIHSRATQCLVDSPPPSVPPGTGSPSPGIPSNGSVTANIGGRAFSSQVGVKGGISQAKQADGRIATILSVGASDSQYTLGLSVIVTDGPGTYEVQLKIDPLDPKKPPRGTASGTLFEGATRSGWAANLATGSGSVTVSSLSSNSASGSFDLVMAPTPGTGASGGRAVRGNFTIRF